MVDVAVSAPLSHDGGAVSVDHIDAVEDNDYRPVGFGRSPSDVDNG